MSIDAGAQVTIILLACGPCVVIVNLLGQVCTLGRAPRTKETLPDFRKWCRVTRHPLVFRRLTGCQRDTPDLGRHNTHDLVLLLFYTIVSLDFGRCPISELTTHSPRMVNSQHHAHTPDSTRCDRVYEMQSCHISCYVMLHATFINFG